MGLARLGGLAIGRLGSILIFGHSMLSWYGAAIIEGGHVKAMAVTCSLTLPLLYSSSMRKSK